MDARQAGDRRARAADRRHAEEGRRPAGRGREGAHGVLRPADRADRRARLHHAHAVARAAHAGGARALGRDAAAPRRRDRRHAAPLRLRRAAGPVVRQRPPAARPDRPPAGRQAASSSTRRRRSRRFSTRRRRRDDEVRTRTAAGARPPGARSHGQAGQQGVLGAARGRVARDGGDVPARRDALQRGAAARPHAHRIRPEAAGAAGEPDHAHRPAHDHRPHLAAGGADRELPGGGAAGQGVLRTAGEVHRASSTTSARGSMAPCRPTTRRPGRSNRGCS